MNDSITVYRNPQFGPVRIIEMDGEPWFALPDLCNALGLTNTAVVRGRLDDALCQTYPIVDALGRTQPTTIVSEAGMYEVVIRSDRPEAVVFRRWVTSEVLPAIRKHGAYLTPEAIEKAILNPDYIIQLATTLKAEKAKRLAAETKVAELEPKAEFYDVVGAIDDGLTISDMAKLIGKKGVGPNKLFRLLKEHGVLMSNNRPYQDYIDRGLLGARERIWRDPVTGEPHPHIQPVVLGKGQDWIRRFVEARA